MKVALLLASLAADVAADTAFLPPEQSVPKVFDQRLLVCNAYPSDSGLKIRKNGGAALQGQDAGEGLLSFRDCTYFAERLKAHDRLDFTLTGAGVEGTFEVGDLPANDAVLLLVVEKRRGGSSLVSFQSFAFPTDGASKDAQLAIIDATSGVSSARLKVEDHVLGTEEKTVSKRVEELNFNRVYAIEAGSYDSSVVDSSGESTPVVSKRMIALQPKQNYVVLLTGDDDKFTKSLVAFPPETKSSAVQHNLAALLAVTLAAIPFL